VPREIPTALTAPAVDKAIKDAKAGEKYIRADAAMPGLAIKVKPSGAIWSVRARISGHQKRFVIGKVVAGDKDEPVGHCSLRTARRRTDILKAQCEEGFNPEAQIREWKTGIGMYRQREAEAAKSKPSWKFEAAVDAFLDGVTVGNAEKTYDGYAYILGGPVRGRTDGKRHKGYAEVSRFAGRQVSTITRLEVAHACAEACARGRSAAEHLRAAFSTMWKFLEHEMRGAETGVTVNMHGIQLPPKPRIIPRREKLFGQTLKIFDKDNDDKRRDVPPPLEIGRAVAIARSGALEKRQGHAIQLTAGSLQRRRAIEGSFFSDFERWDLTPDGPLLWIIPPYMRKQSNRRRAHLTHQVPIVGKVAKAVRILLDMTGGQGYLFPARKRIKTKNPHVDSGWLNKALRKLPGCDLSPHSFRRAFASHGHREIKFSIDDIKLILDHGEGAPPQDVTTGHYALDPLLERKMAIMEKWSAWVEIQVEKAIGADPSISNFEAMMSAAYVKKYGPEQLRKRIAWRARRNRPLWTHRVNDKPPKAAE
jgi:hypothetical protein